MSKRKNVDTTIKNLLLAALTEKERATLLANMEAIDLSAGNVLFEAGEAIAYVYFPNDALVSLISTTREGATIEVGMIGKEGMVGFPVLLGAATTPFRPIVQISGSLIRVPSSDVKTVFDSCGLFHSLLLRHTHVVLTQISQSAVCNRFHNVEERLSRWLLIAQDRVNSSTLQMTQEMLSAMLGTRRASVTIAARMLQKEGLIKYTRGNITILNQRGLEATACECYRIIKETLDYFAAI